jgi:hypothetical protein
MVVPHPFPSSCTLPPPPPPPRAGFLDRIKQAYRRDPGLPNLLVDPAFGADLAAGAAAWRRVVGLAASSGVPVPGEGVGGGWVGVTQGKVYRHTYVLWFLVGSVRMGCGEACCHLFRRLELVIHEAGDSMW